MEITGIIFDFNGTLVYDSKLHAIAWRKFAQEIANQDLTLQQLQTQVFGVHNAIAIKNLFNVSLSDREIEHYSKEKEAFYRQIALQQDNYDLVGGAYDFFKYLKEQKLPFTIASASIKENIDFFVQHFHLDQWINPKNIIYDDGTYPDKVQMFKDAASHLNISIENSLIFEDSISGVTNAISAGCKHIIVIHEEAYNECFHQFPEVIYHANNFKDVLKFLSSTL